jgi:hypothetical protein
MKVIVILLGGFVCLVIGYFAGVYVACDWLYPTSNLCGIYGIFFTGPIGFVVGIVVTWLLSRRGSQT